MLLAPDSWLLTPDHNTQTVFYAAARRSARSRMALSASISPTCPKQPIKIAVSR